jgi:hypothetical protein
MSLDAIVSTLCAIVVAFALGFAVAVMSIRAEIAYQRGKKAASDFDKRMRRNEAKREAQKQWRTKLEKRKQA